MVMTRMTEEGLLNTFRPKAGAPAGGEPSTVGATPPGCPSSPWPVGSVRLYGQFARDESRRPEPERVLCGRVVAGPGPFR